MPLCCLTAQFCAVQLYCWIDLAPLPLWLLGVARQGELVAPVDAVLDTLQHMFASVDTGLVIACSDVLFMFDHTVAYDWRSDGVVGLGIPMPARYGEHHGVYHCDDAGALP